MIRISEPAFLGNEEKYIAETVQDRRLSMGDGVFKFEVGLGVKFEVDYAVAVSSGTAALHLALLAMGVKPGHRVVVPSCSYIATANAVRYCGAEPVFVDVEPDSWTMDLEKAFTAAIDSEAVGFITVNLYGVPCAIPRLPRVWVLEDACESHGAPLAGDVSVLSFYANKIITCGEGGAILTGSQVIRDHCRLLRGQGTSGRSRYVHESLGFNYRMTDMQAAIGRAQVECLDLHLSRRAALRAVYDDLLGQIPQQHRHPGSVDWVVPIRVKDRDRVAADLQNVGVETRPVFPPLHKQPIYKTGTSLPVSEALGREGLLLPLHLGMTETDVEFVCKSLSRALRMCA